jgi:lysophospholipase L1-like esterase
LFNNNQHVELISSAAHIGFTFDGKECKVYAYITDPGGHNYLQYEVDGVYQKRIKISGSKEPFKITAPSGGSHTVWIYKATEAHSGPILLEKIVGQKLQSLKRSDAPLIEFIGNSITCGAAADPSEVPCGEGVYHDQHNAYYAYGPRVARELKTNFIVSGVSGFGIYRTWNTEEPGIPEVYEKADFVPNGTRQWDFSKYKPNVVSIALGTNDLSDGDGQHPRSPFDSTIFVREYIKFVQQVKSKYRDAQIALLSSPMVGGERGIKLKNCLTAIKENIDKQYPSGKPVALFFFKPMQAKGCTGHPNVEDHAILAEEIAPFFKELL